MHISFNEQGWRAFRADTRPGPIHMLNLIRLRDVANDQGWPKRTGLEAYATYSRLSAGPAQAHGMRIVWRGTFESLLIGPRDERWDMAFIAEYPAVEAFLALLRDEGYRAATAHRQAAVADSRLIRLAPALAGQSFLPEPGD